MLNSQSCRTQSMRSTWGRGILLALAFLGFHTAALAGQLTLAWDAVAGAAGYRLYYGQASGNYTNSVDTGSATSVTLPSLTNGATYYLAVTDYTSAGIQSGYSNQVIATVPSVAAPVASFTTSSTAGIAPLTVTMTDTSTGTISTRSWQLGDGTTASGTTVSKTYATAGSYTVTLTVTGSGGSSSTSKTVTVSAGASAPIADFTATPTSGTAPLVVSFANASSATTTAWTWQFGDGTTSTAKNPSHTYSNAGTYTVTLTSSTGSASSTKTRTAYITVSAPTTGGGGTPNVTGLVAAYAFNESNGTTATDSSGSGNNGVINGATRIATGRTGYGNALNFNGYSNLVTVPDSNSLDLTTRMTLEAWVYPTSWMSDWRSIIAKDYGTGELAYYLFANANTNQPAFGGRINGYPFATGLTQLPATTWSHIAGTYDGQYLRLYINSNLVAQQVLTGSLPVTTGALKIGANLWGHYFQGYIDDVRIYNRALSQTEISTDFRTPIGSTSPPTSSNISIQWSASASRTSPAALQGAVLKGNVYIFTTPDTNVSKIDFWFDNPTPTSPTGTPIKTESVGPFDLGGTTGTGLAMPINMGTIAVGAHTLTARATMTDGTTKPAVAATFNVTR